MSIRGGLLLWGSLVLYLSGCSSVHAIEDTTEHVSDVIPHHSLQSPFLSNYWDGGMENWDFGKGTVITDFFVRLYNGWLLNVHANDLTSWQCTLIFGPTSHLPLYTATFSYGPLEHPPSNRDLMRVDITAHSISMSAKDPAGYVRKHECTISDNTVDGLTLHFDYTLETKALKVLQGPEGLSPCMEVHELELPTGYHFGLSAEKINDPAIPLTATGHWDLVIMTVSPPPGALLTYDAYSMEHHEKEGMPSDLEHLAPHPEEKKQEMAKWTRPDSEQVGSELMEQIRKDTIEKRKARKAEDTEKKRDFISKKGHAENMHSSR